MKKLFYYVVVTTLHVTVLFAQDNRMIFKGLPVVKVTMLDGKAEADINKEAKLNASVVITNASGSNFSSSELFSGNITIKGRGNFTWGMAKRPYNIVTCDASFKKKTVTLFGMPSESNWCLLADYEDRTALRTQFSSAISYALGLPWCSRVQKVELYINGDYRGLYTFCEKVERGSNRVNITELKTTDVTGEVVTGGYLLEQQSIDQIGPNDIYFKDAFDKYLSYKLPDADKITVQQNNYVNGYWNSFFTALYNKPFNDTINGYRSIINPISFAQYYLLQDISKNGDAYRNSWYMTKDRNKRIEAGPGWDWGIAWGGFNEYRSGNIQISQPLDTYLPIACLWYGDMMKDPYFANLVKSTFENAKSKIAQVITDVEIYYPKLVASGAVSRDSARWPNIFTDPYSWKYFPTYQENVDNFLSFAKQRVYFQERNIYGFNAAKPTHTDLSQ